jgi:cytochrome c oxidase subunit 2
MRSQDVLHSAYMPYFRAQMNCVPGMVTEFAFEPIYTTAEYRELPYMIEKRRISIRYDLRKLFSSCKGSWT